MKENKIHLTAMVTPETFAEVDRLAERLKLSRSQMVDNLLNVAIDDIRRYEKLGVLKVAEITRDFVANMRHCSEKLITF